MTRMSVFRQSPRERDLRDEQVLQDFLEGHEGLFDSNVFSLRVSS